MNLTADVADIVRFLRLGGILPVKALRFLVIDYMFSIDTFDEMGYTKLMHAAEHGTTLNVSA